MSFHRILAVVFFFIAFTPSADAGLSGESVAVVVNASSIDSITIANHYVALRHIPANHVIWLEDVPAGNSVSLDAFRDKILKPVLETINARGIAPQIQLVAYSAGFPTAVDISPHTRTLTDAAQKKYQTPSASINSLTYFYRYILSDSPDYLGWSSNQYARGKFDRHFINPFGDKKGELFKAAQDLASESKFGEAAEGFESLAGEFPTLPPLRMLAAENWLRADDELKALQQIESAVVAGWSSRRYLTEVEPFKSHFTDKVEQEDDQSDEGLDKTVAVLSPRKVRLLSMLRDVPIVNQGPIGFSSSVEWTSCGDSVPAGSGAMPYMLSCVLAVIGPHGNTLAESIEILTRAATADRKYPDATFGFAKTGDVRVTTREPLYVDAIAWLLSQNRKVEIFPSVLPKSNKTYVGLMLGSADLPLKNRDWSFAPGALAENLTSLGGAFGNGSQTKLTKLLQAGAAISCGAVAEPYALTPKFPAPMIYPYYSDGVSAIEAFYLSISSPYQMLIVGDPLCQPFARAPNDLIEMLRAPVNETTPSTIRFQWQRFPDPPQSTPTAEVELYVLNKLIGKARPASRIDINLPDTLSGVIDCRAVLVGRDPTQPKIAYREQITLGDPNRLPDIRRVRNEIEDRLTVDVDCPGATTIELLHFGRSVASITGESEEITLNESVVGRGPVRLQAMATVDGKPVIGKTIEIQW